MRLSSASKILSSTMTTLAAAAAAASKSQREKMEIFHQLHKGPRLLLLPNAWDVPSAKILEQEGAPAIATTSAGVANAFGYGDGQLIPKALFLAGVGRIISAVQVPVTVDVEAGFGSTVDEICDAVQQLINLGAVGLNLEDLDPATEQLIPIAEQVERIQGVRKLAASNNLPLFINARSDIYLSDKLVASWSPDKKYSETLERLLAYKGAGADGLYVPGLTDPAILSKLIKATQLPMNVLGGPWITSTATLKDAGVARVSIGSGLFRAAVTNTQESYRKMLADDFSFLKGALSYHQVNDLFK